MIDTYERKLLQQAGFTERQINTQMQKFYNLFRTTMMREMTNTIKLKENKNDAI